MLLNVSYCDASVEEENAAVEKGAAVLKSKNATWRAIGRAIQSKNRINLLLNTHRL